MNDFEEVGTAELLKVKGGVPHGWRGPTSIPYNLQEGDGGSGGGGGCGGYYIPINGDGIASSMESSINNVMNSPAVSAISNGIGAVGDAIGKQAELAWLGIKIGVSRMLPVNTGPINPNIMNPQFDPNLPNNQMVNNNGCN
ncbi:hypothetical protein [Maribacter sp. IgM3_T14_3]|uniref:hypothetical protein n=1 Tax=Maribacter sp. IgM3_T14_3 TaxID=3415140 RepID=UPI003C6F26F5